MKLKEDVPSMVNPSTDSMLKQTHSRYALVVLATCKQIRNQCYARN